MPQAAFDIEYIGIEKIPLGTEFSDQCTAMLAETHTTVFVDVETNTTWHGIGPEKDYGLTYCAEVTTISFAWRPETDNEDEPIHTVAWYCETGKWPDRVRKFLTDLFTSGKIIGAHNAIFDMRALSKFTENNITPAKVWCTQVMDRLIGPFNGQNDPFRRFDLLSVAKVYGLEGDPKQVAMKAQRSKITSQPVAEVLEYAAQDSLLAFSIYEWQYATIVTNEFKHLLKLAQIEVAAMAEYCKMAARGIRINKPFAMQRIAELNEIKLVAKAKLAKDGLYEPTSSKARILYIYKTKRIPVLPDRDNPDHVELFTKGGAYSTGADALDKLAELSPENKAAINDLLVYARADDLIGTIESLLAHAALDGRVHSMINILTVTGRRGSSQPNIQNISMRTQHSEECGTMAGVFMGDEGQSLAESDYSNAESFFAGMSAKDNAFMRALLTINPETGKADFHREMAKAYYGEKFTKADAKEQQKMRDDGKSVTFGGAYGAGAAHLAIMIGCTKAEAQAILNNRDRVFSATAAARATASLQMEKFGYITLWTGRRAVGNPKQGFIGWNYINQGGVGEMVKRAIVIIGQAFTLAGCKSRIAIDMHDALVLSVEPSEANEVIPAMIYAMEHIIPEEMNNRTDPPARWRSEFSTKKNAEKWGLGQDPVNVDPVLDSPVMTHVKTLLDKILGKEPLPVEKPVEAEKTADKPEVREYTLRYHFVADIAPEWTYKVQSAAAGSVGAYNGVWVGQADTIKALTSLHEAFEVVHAKAFATMIPAKDDPTIIAQGLPPVTSNELIDVEQSAYLWSEAPGLILKMAMDTGVLDDDHDDLPTLTGGAGFPQLMALLNDRWDFSKGISKLEADYRRLLDMMRHASYPGVISFFLPYDLLTEVS